MLKTGLLIGIYSYIILLLGILGLLTFIPILIVTLCFIIVTFFILYDDTNLLVQKLINLNKLDFLLLIPLSVLLIVNLIGALGPELAFDSLWYHLTIPKVFADFHRVFFIEGGLFYYSAMPKLTEMLYVVGLILGDEIAAKLIHYLFGVLTAAMVYKISRIYFSKSLSILAVLIFYGNLVVAWLSITAYTDLSRAFFESLAFYSFIKFTINKKSFDFYLSAIFLGLAISTKLLALGSIPIFIALIFIVKYLTFGQKIKFSLIYSTLAIFVVSPWLLLSYLDTGNPVYPLFSILDLRNFTIDLIQPASMVKTAINTLLFAPDPLSPIYILMIPIFLFKFRELFKKYQFAIIYCVMACSIWYFTSQEGGTRFLVPYLSIISVLIVAVISRIKSTYIYKMSLVAVIIVILLSVFYRAIANAKYVPVILGIETKQGFLMENLNFGFGDFYDEDNSIKNIVGSNMTLLLNMHNLYYVDFPYVLEEWNEPYEYILIQNGNLPESYGPLKRLYENKKTGVILYKI